MTSSLRISLVLVLFALLAPVAQAQSVSLGADLVSRYIWRGTDFGQSASIQPSLAVSGNGLEIGSWASYSLSADGSRANEHDVWIGYAIDTESSGSFGFGVTDYYFPSPRSLGFFDYSGDGEGAHWIEPYVSFSGPESFPLTFYGAMMAHNDPDNSVYLELSAPVMVGDVEMSLTAGMVGGKSDFYGTSGAAVVNLGLAASKEIPLWTDDASLPISVAYILNPYNERSHLVFGVSVAL